MLFFPHIACPVKPPAQTSKMSAPRPRVRRRIACPRKSPKTSRTRMKQGILSRRASHKSGLAPEKSHQKNTEQQPDVSVAARYPRDTNYLGAAQTPRLRPFHKSFKSSSNLNAKLEILTVCNRNLNFKQKTQTVN